MYRRIEVDDFSLPICGPLSVTITRDDLESVKRLPPRLAVAIARAFHRRKIKYGDLKAKCLAAYPEITLAISYKELGDLEAPVHHGFRLAEQIEDFTMLSIDDPDRQNRRHKIHSTLVWLSKIVEAKTDGRYSIGFRENHIVIIDRHREALDLTVRGKIYPSVIPTCDYGAGRRGKEAIKVKAAYRGFPSDVLIAVAAAGLSGLDIRERRAGYQIEGIPRFYTFSALRSMASETNRYWQSFTNAKSLALTLAGRRMRLLDFNVPEDVVFYEGLLADPSKNVAYAFALAKVIAEQGISQEGRRHPTLRRNKLLSELTS
ncbi:MAG: hypothetical protein WAO98_04140 [Alphaproteobacteria bacterium]